MVAIGIVFLLMLWISTKYDKWDIRKIPKGNITLDEIKDMFELTSEDEH